MKQKTGQYQLICSDFPPPDESILMESEYPKAIFDEGLEQEGWNMFDEDDEDPEEYDLPLSVRKTVPNIVFKLTS